MKCDMSDLDSIKKDDEDQAPINKSPTMTLAIVMGRGTPKRRLGKGGIQRRRIKGDCVGGRGQLGALGDLQVMGW